MKKFLAVCFVVNMSLSAMDDEDVVKCISKVGSMGRKYYNKDISAVRISLDDGDVLFVSYDTSRTSPLLIFSEAKAELNYIALRDKFYKQRDNLNKLK